MINPIVDGANISRSGFPGVFETGANGLLRSRKRLHERRPCFVMRDATKSAHGFATEFLTEMPANQAFFIPILAANAFNSDASTASPLASAARCSNHLAKP